jgi:hypothetical protein
MGKITNPLRVIHRVSEVERIDDSPFLLDLEVVVVEIARDLLLELHAVRIKEEQCSVVVKVALTKTNGELDEVLNLLIPTWNLPWEV